MMFAVDGMVRECTRLLSYVVEVFISCAGAITALHGSCLGAVGVFGGPRKVGGRGRSQRAVMPPHDRRNLKAYPS